TGGGGAINTARMFVQLKPLRERKVNADQVIGRIRSKAARVTGATLFMQAVQDIRVGGRPSSSQYQYTLQGDNLTDLNQWASRLGVTAQAVDEALYDAFGQRQVSTIYTQLNQYHVVFEVDPRYQQSPDALKDIYVRSSSGSLVPLSAFAHYEPTNTTLAASHQGQFPAVTLSFNLAPGASLGEAVNVIQAAQREIGMP